RGPVRIVSDIGATAQHRHRQFSCDTDLFRRIGREVGPIAAAGRRRAGTPGADADTLGGVNGAARAPSPIGRAGVAIESPRQHRPRAGRGGSGRRGAGHLLRVDPPTAMRRAQLLLPLAWVALLLAAMALVAGVNAQTASAHASRVSAEP